MKSILVGPKKKEEKETTYPFLGIASNGHVVLFSDDDTGVTVHDPANGYEVGYHSTIWQMSFFEPLRGKVILHN